MLVDPGTLGASLKKQGKGAARSKQASRLQRSEEEATEAAPTFDPERLGERYHSLTQVHESLVSAFKDDPKPELERLRREVVRQSRDLDNQGLNGKSGTAEEVDKLLTRVNDYRRRWVGLSASFEKHLQEYRKAQSIWDARSERMARPRRGASLEIQTRDDTFLDRALRISEKFSRALSSEDADLLLMQLAEVRQVWPDLKKRAQTELSDHAKQQLTKARPDGKASKARGPVPRRDLARTKRKGTAGVSNSARTRPPTSAVVPRAQIRKDEPGNQVKAARKGTSSDPEQLSAPGQADPSTVESSGAFQSLVWALSGFAVASIIFWCATHPGPLRRLPRRNNRE